MSNALELQTALTAASGSLSPLFAHSPDIATSGDDVDGNSYATSGRIDIGAYQDTVCATNFDGDGR